MAITLSARFCRAERVAQSVEDAERVNQIFVAIEIILRTMAAISLSHVRATESYETIPARLRLGLSSKLNKPSLGHWLNVIEDLTAERTSFFGAPPTPWLPELRPWYNQTKTTLSQLIEQRNRHAHDGQAPGTTTQLAETLAPLMLDLFRSLIGQTAFDHVSYFVMMPTRRHHHSHRSPNDRLELPNDRHGRPNDRLERPNDRLERPNNRHRVPQRQTRMPQR